jgi:PHD/YefM family antitoxin component YafN of YafNO toxin-antitoxin module
MKVESTVNVTQAQQHLPRLIRRDSFAISRHGKIVGFYLSKERIEALIETIELMGKPEFLKALGEAKSGRAKWHSIEDLDQEMSA